MDIFIVTAGEYSDFRIVKVFTDEAKADAYVEARKGSMWDYTVEKWDSEKENSFDL